MQRPKRCKPKATRLPIVVRGRYPNHVWAIDFQFDETADGRQVKILNVTDEFTREALATNAARRITAAGTMAVFDQIHEHRGAPQFLRMDNGPEFIADTLRDWCKELNIQANYCDPGSPWQNGRIKSFNSRVRDELLTREAFDSMWEVCFMLEEHRNKYNYFRPHSALSYLTPVEFATKWRIENTVLARQQVDRQTGSRRQLPSYRAMLDHEGAAGPADIVIAGTAEQVKQRVADLAGIGVTDFAAVEFSSDPQEIADTRAAMKSLI